MSHEVWNSVRTALANLRLPSTPEESIDLAVQSIE